jgi:two-component system sensor histidine kinase BaeS
MNRLWLRLSLAFLIVAWLAVGAVALVVHQTTVTSFRQYLNRRAATTDSGTVFALEDHYAETGSWTGADSLQPGPKGNSGGNGNGKGAQQGQRRGGAQVMLADANGVIVAATDETRIGTLLTGETLANATPLEVDGQRVGWLAQETPGSQALGATEEQFLSDATSSLAITAAGAALLAVIIGGLLAWQLTRPIRALTHAAHDLAEGELGRQVPVSGPAEMTDLAQAFNRMSHDLAEGEGLRRRMAADVAHELRTPVSVLRGHLEAMLDGVFPLDTERLAVAYDQTIHLARLVDDLRLLTRAEAGNLPLHTSECTPDSLVGSAVESFSPLALDAGIALESEIAPGLPSLSVDVDRIHQVMGNLLANALRHTPADGRIVIRVARAGEAVRFAVANTGEGLTPEEAAAVFTPFWRAKEAHERDKNGSGLGLAIARQLVTLHGGRIWVERAPGLTSFIFELPVSI